MLNKHNLNIHKICTAEESRFALAGIQVEPGRTMATDAHCLISVTTPNVESKDFPAIDGMTGSDIFEPFLLCKKTADKVMKAIPTEKLYPILSNVLVGKESDGSAFASIGVTDIETPVVFKPRKLSGQFPNADLVLAKTENALASVSFNAVLMQKLMGQFVDFNKAARVQTCTLEYHGDASQLMMRARNSDTGQEMVAALMPMRLDKETSCEKLSRSHIKDLRKAINHILSVNGWSDQGKVMIEPTKFDDSDRLITLVAEGDGTAILSLFTLIAEGKDTIHQLQDTEEKMLDLGCRIVQGATKVGFNLYDLTKVGEETPAEEATETAPAVETVEEEQPIEAAPIETAPVVETIEEVQPIEAAPAIESAELTLEEKQLQETEVFSIPEGELVTEVETAPIVEGFKVASSEVMSFSAADLTPITEEPAPEVIEAVEEVQPIEAAPIDTETADEEEFGEQVTENELAYLDDILFQGRPPVTVQVEVTAGV